MNALTSEQIQEIERLGAEMVKELEEFDRLHPKPEGNYLDDGSSPSDFIIQKYAALMRAVREGQ